MFVHMASGLSSGRFLAVKFCSMALGELSSRNRIVAHFYPAVDGKKHLFTPETLSWHKQVCICVSVLLSVCLTTQLYMQWSVRGAVCPSVFLEMIYLFMCCLFMCQYYNTIYTISRHRHQNIRMHALMVISKLAVHSCLCTFMHMWIEWIRWTGNVYYVTNQKKKQGWLKTSWMNLIRHKWTNIKQQEMCKRTITNYILNGVQIKYCHHVG